MDKLGEGAFGQVIKSEVVDLYNRPGLSTVAVKMLKGMFQTYC